jgi:hypothetical protein
VCREALTLMPRGRVTPLLTLTTLIEKTGKLVCFLAAWSVLLGVLPVAELPSTKGARGVQQIIHSSAVRVAQIAWHCGCGVGLYALPCTVFDACTLPNSIRVVGV